MDDSLSKGDDVRLVPFEEALGLVREGKGALQQASSSPSELQEEDLQLARENKWKIKYERERELRWV
jgi:hypothetical protein